MSCELNKDTHYREFCENTAQNRFESMVINQHDEVYQSKLYLNVAPCQFVESKTKKSIEYLNEVVLSTYINNTNTSGTRPFTIVCTNNSLIDGRQWSVRLDTGEIKKVAILSSKRDAAFNSIGDFVLYLTQIQNIEDYIDVLVICTNKTRIKDLSSIITIINITKTINLPFYPNGFEYTIMFDEADKSDSLCYSTEFINKFKNERFIESIHLITATPFEKFWKKMAKDCGITQLENIRNIQNLCIGEKDHPQDLINDYRNVMKNDDDDESHNIIHSSSEYDILNPVSYIKHIYNTEIKGKNLKPIRLFAPSAKDQHSHNEVKNFFLKENFIVLIINGKDKKFCFPDNTSITIDNFNKQYLPNINNNKKNKRDIILMETLVKFNEIFPNSNLTITGFYCIERGVTFQTIGFNFTDMIIPKIDNIEQAVQIIGRANGNKKYVTPHNIYIQEGLYTEIEKYIKFLENIIKLKPENISINNFRTQEENVKMLLKEHDESKWCVPEVIYISPEDYNNVTEKIGNQYNREKILNMIKTNISIDGYEMSADCYTQNTDDGYKRNITRLINFSKKGKPTCQLKKKEKGSSKNLFSVHLAHKDNAIIVTKYNGAK
jgi:hypothetical protein